MITQSDKVRLCSRLLLVLLIAFPLAGCIQETTIGSQTTIVHQWWVQWAWIIGSVIVFISAFLCLTNLRCSIPLFLVGLVGIGGALDAYFSYVTIDADHFSEGHWAFSPVSNTVQFDDIASLEYIKEKTVGGRSSTYYLLCAMKNGQLKTVGLDGDFRLQAIPRIMAAAKAKGVIVINPDIQPIWHYR